MAEEDEWGGGVRAVTTRVWVTARETREGWPMLIVETEVNGDSKSTNIRVTSLVGS